MAATIKSTKSNASDRIIGNGINEITNEFQVNIFPNPSSGIFTVQSPSSRIRSVDVYSVYGEKVYSQIVNSKSQIIRLDLPNGIYFLKVNSEKGSTTKKIIINK